MAILPPGSHADRSPNLAPTGSHLLLFGDFPARAATREDGHPLVQMSPPGLERMARMYAGGRLQFLSPIPVDSIVTRTERIAEVRERQGRSGRLVFVTVAASYSIDGSVVIEERRNIVYRDAAPHRDQAVESAPAHREVLRHGFDAIDLFRFSALSFNSHRIHYDADYARTVEHYAALVVQGPLLAVSLMGLAGSPRGFEFQLRRPSFAGEVLSFAQVAGAPGEWLVVGPDGTVRLTGSTTEV